MEHRINFILSMFNEYKREELEKMTEEEINKLFEEAHSYSEWGL